MSEDTVREDLGYRTMTIKQRPQRPVLRKVRYSDGNVVLLATVFAEEAVGKGIAVYVDREPGEEG